MIINCSGPVLLLYSCECTIAYHNNPVYLHLVQCSYVPTILQVLNVVIGCVIVVSLACLAVVVALCIYCCVFRYKMCTPIIDPIDNPPANRQLYTYDFEVCCVQKTKVYVTALPSCSIASIHNVLAGKTFAAQDMYDFIHFAWH